MSEPQVDTSEFLLDGELPRLGATPHVSVATPPPAPPADMPLAPLAPPASGAPAVVNPAPLPRTGAPAPMLSAPGSTRLFGTADATNLLGRPTSLPAPSASEPALAPTTGAELPTLPTAAPAVRQVASDESVESDAPAGATTAPEHPMAHLMPQKTVPSEASRRAAELRAAKKAKALKIKIAVAIVAIAVAAIVGPPLARWFADALDDTGGTPAEVDG